MADESWNLDLPLAQVEALKYATTHRRLSDGLQRRAQLVLAMATELNDDDLAERFDLLPSVVSMWRIRWRDHQPELAELEGAALWKRVVALLEDEPLDLARGVFGAVPFIREALVQRLFMSRLDGSPSRMHEKMTRIAALRGIHKGDVREVRSRATSWRRFNDPSSLPMDAGSFMWVAGALGVDPLGILDLEPLTLTGGFATRLAFYMRLGMFSLPHMNVGIDRFFLYYALFRAAMGGKSFTSFPEYIESYYDPADIGELARDHLFSFEHHPAPGLNDYHAPILIKPPEGRAFADPQVWHFAYRSPWLTWVYYGYVVFNDGMVTLYDFRGRRDVDAVTGKRPWSEGFVLTTHFSTGVAYFRVSSLHPSQVDTSQLTAPAGELATGWRRTWNEIGFGSVGDLRDVR